jgi:hypothetical protein
MFEIELVKSNEISIILKKNTININVAQSMVSAGLTVGNIKGPGEFEIGDVSIVGVDVSGKVAYRVDIGGIKIGVVGEGVDQFDDLGPIDILATAEATAVNVIDPKIIVPIDNIEKIVSEVKAEVKEEKRLKIKNETSLPVVMEICRLG